LCCSVLQCVAVCCSVLQCVAVCVALCCSMLQYVLQYVTVCCSVLQCVAVSWHFRVAGCSHGTFVLQVAVCCSVSQCVALERSRSSTYFAESFAGSNCARFDHAKEPCKEPCNTGATPQRTLQHWSNPAKNPATLEQPRKYGHRSTLRSKEIWPQGCERPNGSRSARLSRVSDMGWLRLVGSLKL